MLLKEAYSNNIFWGNFMNKVVLIILAIFLPPIAVFLKSGVGKDLLINIILCLLMFFPGVVHALWTVTK